MLANFFANFNWPLLVAFLGSAGAGGVLVKLYGQWQTGYATNRKQTDDVALDLVETLNQRVILLEGKCETLTEEAKTERELCDAKLSSFRYELANVEGSFDALLLALKYAPADRHEAIVNEVATWREKKKAERLSAAQRTNSAAQLAVSSARVRSDAAGQRRSAGGDA